MDQSVALQNLISPEIAKAIADLKKSESPRPAKTRLDKEGTRVPSLSDRQGWKNYIEAKLKVEPINFNAEFKQIDSKIVDIERPWKKELDRIFDRFNIAKPVTPNIGD